MKHIIILSVILLIIVAGGAWLILRKQGYIPEPQNTPAQELTKKAPPPQYTEITENYETGELKLKYMVRADKLEIKHGEYTEYYKNGNKKMQLPYRNNTPYGSLYYWYENGKKALKGYIKNGVRHGGFTEWHPSGKKKYSYSYSRGILSGEWLEYYDNNKNAIMYQKAYQDGILAGTVRFYSITGKLKDTFPATDLLEQ